jgi:uncharacterized protein (TIGR03083 family)
MADYARLLADEVSDMSAFLRGLSEEQWEQPSLCGEFTVREVIGHMLSAVEASIWTVIRMLPGAGFSMDRVSVDMAKQRVDGRTSQELIADFETHDPRRGLARLIPLKTAFLERVVHHQDMRRPLGMPRQVPEERLTAVLDVAVSGHNGVNSKKRAAGLALRATDVDWSQGTGPDVEGSGEAILMALCNRAVAVEDLSGDGVEALRERLS